MFTKNKIRKATWILATTTIVCIVASYAAVAATTRMLQPTVVVTFDIERVLAGLDERANAEAKLEAIKNKIIDEKKKRFDTVNALQQTLQSAADADQEELVEEIEQQLFSSQSYDMFSERYVDGEKSLMLRDIYYKIQTAVEEVAKANGYDIVTINDVGRSIEPNANAKIRQEIQVLELIGQRRTMYASDQIDITEQIVTHMNLEWGKKQQ